MQYIVSFSGGKDSTAMLFMMLERGVRVDRVVFVDTGKEFPQMYDHIREVQERILPIKIEWVKIDFDYWMYRHVRKRGKNKGKCGYGWPNPLLRWCTGIKRDSFSTYVVRSHYDPHKWTASQIDPSKYRVYCGITSDEKLRLPRSNNMRPHIKTPLVDWGITQEDSLDYCRRLGFSWGGLYDKFARVSCYCCPFKRLKELYIIYRDYPDLWKQIKQMDERAFNKFRPKESVIDLERRFMKWGSDKIAERDC